MRAPAFSNVLTTPRGDRDRHPETNVMRTFHPDGVIASRSRSSFCWSQPCVYSRRLQRSWTFRLRRPRWHFQSAQEGYEFQCSLSVAITKSIANGCVTRGSRRLTTPPRLVFLRLWRSWIYAASKEPWQPWHGCPKLLLGAAWDRRCHSDQHLHRTLVEFQQAGNVSLLLGDAWPSSHQCLRGLWADLAGWDALQKALILPQRQLEGQIP